MLVLVRHGQSQWNLENRFTGWVDVPLSEKGLQEAKTAGEVLLKQNIEFDCAYTSYLKRAIKTLWIVLDELDNCWLPVTKDWQLNERHYGGLQGLNKKETLEKHGEEQVFQWRRSYATPPPEATGEIQQKQQDRRYKDLVSSGAYPQCEALKHTVDRVVPYWEKEIAPQIKAGKNVLVVAHGNSLRALIKHLAGLSDEEITKFEFATANPLVCDINADLKLKEYKFLL